MPKKMTDDLGKELASLRRKVDALASGSRLDHSSLDGTTLYLRDHDGNLSGRLGRQPDGSNGVHVVKVQPPPQLTAAILTVGEQAGTCLVEWDGRTFDGRRMPLIHGHTEIWAELVGEDWDPTVAPGEPAKRVGTIRDRTGGEVVVALPQAGTWAVWLRAMGADRETAGPWSPVSTVEIKPLVDTEAIEAELEDARDRITEADERLTAGQATLTGHLDDLNENRLPALTDRLDTIEPVIEDYDGRIIAAQDGADSARDTAEDLRDNVLPPLSADLSDLTENRLPAVEGTLDTTRLGMENLRDVRLPDLQDTLNDGLEGANEWREVGAVSASSVRIGDYENLLPDDFLWEFREQGLSSGLWSATTDGASGWATILDQRGWPIGLRFTHASWSGNTSRLSFDSPSGVGIRVKPGDSFSLSGSGFSAAANPSNGLTVGVRYATDTGAFVQRVAVGGMPEGDFSHQWTVPDNTDIQRMQVEFTANTNTAGSGHWGDFRFRRRVTGELIVDGAISAQHIMAQSIAGAVGEFLQLTADQIDTENLAAYLATIIELDAGQITSGQISTARLDAESVAAAVANFLALDALEINVEQLAGEIANIIEITAESIASGAISARHLAIADFENLLTESDLEDFRDNGTSSAQWLLTEGNAAAGTWTTISNQSGGRILLRWSAGDNNSARRISFRKGGQGIPVREGDQFYIRLEGWTSAASGGEIQMQARYGEQDRSFIRRANLATRISGSVTEHSWTVTNAPNVRYMDIEFRALTGATGDGHWEIANFRRKNGGELIVDGSIQSRNVDTEEFFAAEAVIEKIWTDIVHSRLIESQGIITEDMIATGAITTPKLTVTEEMVGQIARLIRVEAGSLASNDIEAMRIVSSLIEASVYLIHDADGDVSVRLDGMNNFLRGSVHAGVSDNSEIHLDYGTVSITTGWEGPDDPGEIIEQIESPYIQFNHDRGDQVVDPKIWIDNEGQMRLSPGRTTAIDPHRGRLRIHGDIQANRFIGTRAEVTDLVLNTGSSDQPGGLSASGSEPGRVRQRGRMPTQRQAHDTFATGTTSSSYEVTPGGSWRAGVAYWTPAPTGTVYPFINFHIDAWTSDNYNIVSGSTSSRSAAGFTWNAGHIRGGNTATFWVQYFAVWR